MSKISYPQLVKNLADAYRTAIGSTDPIAIGELTTKVTEAMNSGGVSVEYKSITYNEDNTITLIDKDDVVHTMSCTYEDSKLTSITYDNRVINLTYDGDILTSINNKEINLENAPVQPQIVQKPMTVETGVEVIMPIYVNTEIEINNNIEIETSVAIEESEE